MGTITGQPISPTASGVIGQWNGSVHDDSGNNANGTIHGNVYFPQGEFGPGINTDTEEGSYIMVPPNAIQHPANISVVIRLKADHQFNWTDLPTEKSEGYIDIFDQSGGDPQSFCCWCMDENDPTIDSSFWRNICCLIKLANGNVVDFNGPIKLAMDHQYHTLEFGYDGTNLYARDCTRNSDGTDTYQENILYIGDANVGQPMMGNPNFTNGWGVMLAGLRADGWFNCACHDILSQITLFNCGHTKEQFMAFHNIYESVNGGFSGKNSFQSKENPDGSGFSPINHLVSVENPDGSGFSPINHFKTREN